MWGKYKVLIVEDEFIALKYLKSILLSLGFNQIHEAKDANSALELVRSNKIDLVFMDINLSKEINGIKCAELLNEIYFLPIIFTTAYGDTKTISEASTNNIFGYLIKPFEANDVEATINVAFFSINKIRKNDNQIELGDDFIYYLNSQTLKQNKETIDLTRKEILLLDILCKNINQNVSYESLQEYIWNTKNVSSSTIRDTVSRLKKKVPIMNLYNISNFGYILKSI